MAEALVNADLIRWARGRAQLSSETAASQLSVSSQVFDAWESGERKPTFNQARRIASKFHVPFGFLFLTDPPAEDLPIPDLRTVTGSQPVDASPEFIDTLNDALRKQQWLKEVRETSGDEPATFIALFDLATDAEIIAEGIRSTLQIDDDLRRQSRTWEAFLTELIARAEAAGVLVLRNGVVGNNTHRVLDETEFRGFAISDPLAPLIFINSQDAKSAQIFTLIHELAHLWVGESGVSNPDFRRRAFDQTNAVERLCNRVAAETLVPAASFFQIWDSDYPIETNLRSAARHFRVSTLVVLRQALDLDLLPDDVYWSYFQQEREQYVQRPESTGGNFYPTVLIRNSHVFTVAVLSSLGEGGVGFREAARLLNVKVGTLEGIADYLSERGAFSG